MWGIIFSDVPSVLRTRFQIAPLELETDNFYLARKDFIEPHLQRIHTAMGEEILITSRESELIGRDICSPNSKRPLLVLEAHVWLRFSGFLLRTIEAGRAGCQIYCCGASEESTREKPSSSKLRV